MKTKNLKETILLATLILSASVAAKPRIESSVDSDFAASRLVGTIEVNEYGVSQSDYEIDCVKSLEPKKLKMIQDQDFELFCSKVFWSQSLVGVGYRRHGRWSGSIEGSLSAYCLPRMMSDIQLVSLHRTCLLNPVQSCFDQDILTRLNQVQPTIYKEIGITCNKLAR